MIYLNLSLINLNRIPMSLNLRKPLAFFDLETTGINFAKDRIVEISIMKVNPNQSTGSKTYLVNPTIPIPAEASEVHGIYDDDVKDAPTFKQIARELEIFLEGCDLAGFNSNRFDIPMLVEEFLRVGINFKLENRKMIDVQKIFHTMEKRTLGAAYQFYCGKDLKNAHSAQADVNATYEILLNQINRYEELKNDVDFLSELSSDGQFVDSARRMIYKNGKEVFNFGKHKGRNVEEVFQKEPQYYNWIMNNDFPLHTKQKLTEINLRQQQTRHN